jgi:hypothetical protein
MRRRVTAQVGDGLQNHRTLWGYPQTPSAHLRFPLRSATHAPST